MTSGYCFRVSVHLTQKRISLLTGHDPSWGRGWLTRKGRGGLVGRVIATFYQQYQTFSETSFASQLLAPLKLPPATFAKMLPSEPAGITLLNSLNFLASSIVDRNFL